MKPYEVAFYDSLPEDLILFRAHRENETDCLAYSFSEEIAQKFLTKRPGGHIGKYVVKKTDILATFLRRMEKEAIVLNPAWVKVYEKEKTLDIHSLDQ